MSLGPIFGCLRRKFATIGQIKSLGGRFWAACGANWVHAKGLTLLDRFAPQASLIFECFDVIEGVLRRRRASFLSVLTL